MNTNRYKTTANKMVSEALGPRLEKLKFPKYINENIKTIDKPALIALAVKVGKTRVIDNMILYP